MPACRFCRAPLNEVFADLGVSPLANSYLREDQLAKMEPFFPLKAWVCGSCMLVQLEEYETPAGIFSDYAYLSSYSDTWVEHARRYADAMRARFGIGAQSLVVELASNDGLWTTQVRAVFPGGATTDPFSHTYYMHSSLHIATRCNPRATDAAFITAGKAYLNDAGAFGTASVLRSPFIQLSFTPPVSTRFNVVAGNGVVKLMSLRRRFTRSSSPPPRPRRESIQARVRSPLRPPPRPESRAPTDGPRSPSEPIPTSLSRSSASSTLRWTAAPARQAVEGRRFGHRAREPLHRSTVGRREESCN